MDKSEVNKLLREFFDESFIKLWWNLELPGLGKVKPNDLWEADPQQVLDYVKGY